MHRSWSRAVTFGVILALATTLGAPAAHAQQARDGFAPASGCKPKKKARKLVDDLREDLAGVEEQIRNHPYIAALEAGEVTRDNLRAFAGEQYHVIQSDLRSAAQLVARYGATPSGVFFRGILDSEFAVLGYLLQFAQALGWDEEDLQAYEPNPQAQTYPSYVTWLSVNATDAQVAAGFLLNFPVFGENLGRMGAALRTRYGFSAKDTAYFDFLSGLPPTFEADALGIIGAGLCGCADERAIRRTARLLQSYELDFWDGVAEN